MAAQNTSFNPIANMNIPGVYVGSDYAAPAAASGAPNAFAQPSPQANPYISTGNPLIGGGQQATPNQMPITPGYEAGYTPANALLPAYEQAQANANKGGFNQFQAEALNGGPSAWTTLAEQQGNNNMNMARDQAAATSAGQTANTEANLAAGGGLSSGARERAVEGGARSTMNADQSLQRQNMQNQGQLLTNDAQQKMNMQAQLPGMEQQQLSGWEGVNATDLGAQIQEAAQQNAYNMGLYNTQANAYGAGQTANAMQAATQAQNSGGLFGQGGLLGLGI